MKLSHRITRLVLIGLAVLALAGSAAIGAGIAGGVILRIAGGGVTYRHRHVPSGLAH